MQIKACLESDFSAVYALWSKAFPDNPPRNRAQFAIPAKPAVQPELFMVAHDGGLLAGTIMAGFYGHRGWLYCVAAGKQHQRKGIGTALVRAAEAALRELGCDKGNLQVRAGSAAAGAFCRRLGYRLEERIIMGRSL